MASRLTRLAGKTVRLPTGTWRDPDVRAGHGQALTLAMTGPRPGVALTAYTGPKSVNLDDGAWFTTYNGGSRDVRGMIFDGCSFTLNAAVAPFTFADCTFGGTPPAASIFGGTGSGGTLLHCDFDVRGQTPRASRYQGVYLRTVTARNCRFRGFDTAFAVGVNCIYDRCWISDLMPYDPVIDQHQTGVSAQQSFNIGGSRLTRCKILSAHTENPSGLEGISSAISHYNDGTHTGLVLEDNYLATAAYYALYCGALTGKPSPYSTNLKVRGTVFGRDFARWCGAAYPAYGFNMADPTNEWDNNTYGPLGPYNLAGDAAEGTAITAPGVSATSNR